MTDHKASVKISFSIYGVTEMCDMYINYDTQGVDARVIEFFERAYEKARIKYDNECYEADKDRREADIKERELRQLAELKKKYDS